MGKHMKDRLSVTVAPSVIVKIKERAKKDNRSFSNMVEQLLLSALKEKAA